MPKRVEYICDVCGSRIHHDVYRIQNIKKSKDVGYKTAYLCQICVESLLRVCFVKNMRGPVTQQYPHAAEG